MRTAPGRPSPPSRGKKPEIIPKVSVLTHGGSDCQIQLEEIIPGFPCAGTSESTFHVENEGNSSKSFRCLTQIHKGSVCQNKGLIEIMSRDPSEQRGQRRIVGNSSKSLTSTTMSMCCPQTTGPANHLVQELLWVPVSVHNKEAHSADVLTEAEAPPRRRETGSEDCHCMITERHPPPSGKRQERSTPSRTLSTPGRPSPAAATTATTASSVVRCQKCVFCSFSTIF